MMRPEPIVYDPAKEQAQMRWRIFWLLAALLALAIVIVGIDDPAQEQATYCSNVKAGIWPDYEGTYKQECGGTNPPQFHESLTK